MAWSLVGSSATKITDTPLGAGQAVTLPGVVASGDLAVVLVASDIVADDIITTAGYTVTDNGAGTSPGWAFGWKVIAADTTVTVTRGAQARICLVQVWRGENTGDALDVDLVTANSADGNQPDPPNLAGVAAGALVFAWGAMDDDETTVSVWPTGYTNQQEGNTNGIDGTGATAAICSKESTGADENPSAYTFGTTDAWFAGTISFNIAAAAGHIPQTASAFALQQMSL